MYMLNDLKSKIVEIEKQNDWEYNFISDILKKKEEDEKHKLTKKQFKKLAELHEKYRPYALSCFYKS